MFEREKKFQSLVRKNGWEKEKNRFLIKKYRITRTGLYISG